MITKNLTLDREQACNDTGYVGRMRRGLSTESMDIKRYFIGIDGIVYSTREEAINDRDGRDRRDW